MATIKTLDTLVESIADSSAFIQSYEYGFREDYNSTRDRNKFPKLIFRVLSAAPTTSQTLRDTEGAWYTLTCKAFLMQLYNQNDLDTISQIHTDIDAEMDNVFKSIHDNEYRVTLGGREYYDRFENSKLAGVGYDFTVDIWLC